MSALLLTLAYSAPGLGQAPDALQLVLGGTVAHDSNLFRLADSVDPRSLGRTSRSETVHSGYVGLRLDKPYSLQRFQLEVTQTAYRHDTYTELDFDALAYRGAWLWHLTPAVSGVLSADHNEMAVPFSDFQGTQRNVRKTDSRVLSVDGSLFGGWHLILGAGQSRQTSSVPVAAEADFESERVEIGLRYLLRSGSSVGITRRINDGDYLNRAVISANVIGESFREHQTEVQASWIVGGRSTLAGRLTRLDRQHPDHPERDFTAQAGSASFAWVATGKLQVTLTVQRDVSASLDPLTPYTRRDSVAITPVWEATARIAVRPRLARIRTDYVFGGPSMPPREDDTDITEVAITWTATRNIALNASVMHEERSSNQPGLDYGATVTRLGASFAF